MNRDFMDRFSNLLSAVHNINHECEPGNQAGIDMTQAALETVKQMKKLSSDGLQGVAIVGKLLNEVLAQPDPLEYMEKEAEKAWGEDEDDD